MRTTITIKAIFLALLTLQFGACATTSPVGTENGIEVLGKVEVIGTSMAKGYMLKTANRNSYLLEMSDEMAREINAEFPKVIEISGTLYLGDWVGEKQACIKVESWKLAEN